MKLAPKKLMASPMLLPDYFDHHSEYLFFLDLVLILSARKQVVINSIDIDEEQNILPMLAVVRTVIFSCRSL